MAMNPNRSLVTRVAALMGGRQKDLQRALPSSKGGEPQGQLQTSRTEIYSYFTQPSRQSQLLFSAENWVKIRLVLETAGPVAVGTSAEITPVLSGHGILLDTDEPFEVILSRSNRMYIAAETVNRVAVTIEPIPWLEQINADNRNGYQAIAGTFVNVGNSIIAAINGLAGLIVPTSSSGKTIDDMACPPPPQRVLPRALTLGRPLPKLRR